MDDSVAVRGPWVATLTDSFGFLYREVGDRPSELVAVSVVRGTAVPQKGRLPGTCRVSDVLYRIEEFDSVADLTARWIQAQAVAAALNGRTQYEPVTNVDGAELWLNGDYIEFVSGSSPDRAAAKPTNWRRLMVAAVSP
jgi:hypothetical protein